MPNRESRAGEDGKRPLAPAHRARFEGEQRQEYDGERNVVDNDDMDHASAFVIGALEHHRAERKDDGSEQRQQQIHIEWTAIVLR